MYLPGASSSASSRLPSTASLIDEMLSPAANPSYCQSSILSEEKLTYEDIIRRDNKEKYLNDVKIDGNMIISRNLNKVENLIRKTDKTINDIGLSRQVSICC